MKCSRRKARLVVVLASRKPVVGSFVLHAQAHFKGAAVAPAQETEGGSVAASSAHNKETGRQVYCLMSPMKSSNRRIWKMNSTTEAGQLASTTDRAASKSTIRNEGCHEC